MGSDDAKAVYAGGEDWRKQALSKMWPGLHEVLAGLAAPKRVWGCAMGDHSDKREYVPVVGRLWLNGPPACAEHLKGSKRPGGFPLDRINPADWRDDNA